MNRTPRSTVCRSADHPTFRVSLGATYLGEERCRFLVWAPKVQRMAVKIVGGSERLLEMAASDHGYFERTADQVPAGTKYFYRLDDRCDRPDPASRFQPDGVHQASAVVNPQFDWEDDGWHGLPLCQLIIYEVHVGTFSEEGTFDGAARYLDDLAELGITAVELMPVAQFPGGRNWGYDGVHPFAVQNTYGGPQALKRLVNACHQRGLAVVMDVVYNHLGPEGNYLGEFGNYFTDRHQTPWGAAINFDDRDSDEVRRFFIENALYWINEFHIDALRLDAVHAILDFSAQPFLQELAEAVRLEGRRLNRQVYTIAESSLNDARLVRSTDCGGLGVDAQWCDDLHHSLRTTLTGERQGYYADFRGFADLVKVYGEGHVLDGRYCVSRGRRHGNSARDLALEKFVVCSQNHDQVGNRMLGERLTELLDFEALKLAAAVVLLSPYQPLLFMGEEYGETARFQYFVSHLDPELVEAVRQGRRQEFEQFQWSEDPPDPAAEETFRNSKLRHGRRHEGQHGVLRDFYRELIGLRKSHAALAQPERRRMETIVLDEGQVFAVRRWAANGEIVTVFHTGDEIIRACAPLSRGTWTTVLDSASARWQGPGSDIPPRIESDGQVSFRWKPRTVTIFTTGKCSDTQSVVRG